MAINKKIDYDAVRAIVDKRKELHERHMRDSYSLMARDKAYKKHNQQYYFFKYLKEDPE